MVSTPEIARFRLGDLIFGGATIQTCISIRKGQLVDLLRTKRYIPRKRAHLVPRPRPVERINSGRGKKLTLISYTNRLLEAMSSAPEEPETREAHDALLSERELEVLRYLAKGQSCEEIGKQLFLNLTTIQFHVKNIYNKLLLNKQMQVIAKAGDLNLI